MSKRKDIPSDRPVVLRPSTAYNQATYLKQKAATNKKIAGHRHRSR